MRLDLIPQLCCPECRGDLRIARQSEVEGEALREGELACEGCGRAFAVAEGIPILLPDSVPNAAECDVRRRVSESTTPNDWQGIYDRNHFRTLAELELERMAAGGGSLRILDIGVGWGAAYLPVAGQATLWGLDFSFESLVLMRRLFVREGAPVPALVCASLTAIPLQGLRFDLIRSVQVYQHLRDPEDIRRSFSLVIDNLLVPGGAFVVENLNYRFTRSLAPLRRMLGRGGSGSGGKEEQTNDYFLRRYEADDFLALLSEGTRSRTHISFTETLFHPELRMTPRSRAVARADALLAASPLGPRLGRQIRLTVTARG